MNLPPPNWPPPAPAPVFIQRRRRIPNERRRKLGWRLLIVAVVLLAVGIPTVGARGTRMFRLVERAQAPGSVQIDCHQGDTWRIGPRTGSRRQVGNLTVSSSGPGVLESATVVLDGTQVTVRPMTGAVETLTIFNSQFTAVATFTCPENGPATVTVDGPEGVEFAVFPSIWGSIGAFAIAALGLLVVVVLAIVGVVLVARHRRSRQPS